MKVKVVVSLIVALSIVVAGVYVIPGCSEKKPDKKIEKDNSNRLRTPEEELAGFQLADGFEIELVASEKEGIINPIDLTFDDAGRLWTQTARMYPLDPVADAEWSDLLRLMDNPDQQKTDTNFKRVLDLYQGRTRGDDKIYILSDLYNGKRPATASVWAEGLAIPMSIMPYKNGAFVAQGSELLFLNDSDHDGKSDERKSAFTGFGFVDTHTLTHALVRGPGGWIYFSHGALNKGEVRSLQSDAKLHINYSKIARFSLDAKKIELVGVGLNNIWGFQLRGNGQWYETEANDLGYSVVPAEGGTGFPGIGAERLRSYQPWMPELHKFRVGGTGISGLAFADDLSGSFPDEWKDVALLANPITSSINAVKIVRNADGSVTANHLSDLLTSEDKDFRPVNMEFGPDGCLYIADWYDKIISHNEISRSDPERDKSYGRIWRIRHKSQKPRSITNFYTVKTEELVDQLTSPSIWAKRAAWHQIADRDTAETIKLAPALVKLAADQSQDEITRIHALWSLEAIRRYDEKLMNELLADRADNLRREAVRTLAAFSLSPAQIAAAIKKDAEDPNPMVRSQVLRTLSDIGAADASTIDILVRACKPELPGNNMGGPYERKFERYLALKALEQYPKELEVFMASPAAADIPPAHFLWAIQALPNGLKEQKFLSLWPAAGISQLDESTFIMVAKMLSNPRIYAMVKPVIDNKTHAAAYVDIVLKNQQQVQSERLSSLLELPVKELLQSADEKERQLALDVIGRMNIKAPQGAVVALINDKTPEATLKLVLKALEVNPKANKAHFINILQNKHYVFDLRVSALNSLAKADSVAALQNLQTWLPEFNNDQKKTLVNILAGSGKGAGVLLKLYAQKLISVQDFTHSAAERLYSNDLKNEVARTIVQELRKKADLDRRAFSAKLNNYVAIVEKKDGDPLKGKVIFETVCLLCHKVGNKGQDIAPALDGSAARANEPLLTAILNPDLAVEGGYSLFRLTKNDNSVLEGYLFNRDDRGTTLAFMGGSKIFVQTADIKSQGFVAGRSFMPAGLLDGRSDEQVADLFAYIKTLK